MQRISPSRWQPIGVDNLEDEAERVVRAASHSSVVAGPGAGKTELLAQRACYLLQTGLCPAPSKILAISYKRDAARNLADRVETRCGREFGRRFDSLTFDAFSKGLVDRFIQAIPEKYRPTPDYQPTAYKKWDVADILNSMRPSLHPEGQRLLSGIAPDSFLKDYVHCFRLGVTEHPTSIGAWAAQQWWNGRLQAHSHSFLTFPMIGQLAELMLRENPLIQKSLRASYSHVFLDEFQDATRTQFTLLETAFADSDAIVSAVGDNKQRIMGWAEALDDAFGELDGVFPSTRSHLLMNYRSSPELVEIQRFLIEGLDQNARIPTAGRDFTGISDSCAVWKFPDPRTEAIHVAGRIEELMADGVSPGEICVLVKQLPDLYGKFLVKALADRGIEARNEGDVQDLLLEPVVDLLIPILRCIAGDLTVWSEAVERLAAVKIGSMEDDAVARVDRELSRFVRSRKKAHEKSTWIQPTLNQLIDETIDFVEITAIRGAFPNYRQQRFLDKTIETFRDLLISSANEGDSLKSVLDRVAGTHAVPIMTIHKSKGLEYDTVIFLGLEDGAFWTFSTQPEEDKCAFFVAFSRAKNRVLFTFSQRRQSRNNRPVTTQNHKSISALYDMLHRAGVPKIEF